MHCMHKEVGAVSRYERNLIATSAIIIFAVACGLRQLIQGSRKDKKALHRTVLAVIHEKLSSPSMSLKAILKRYRVRIPANIVY